MGVYKEFMELLIGFKKFSLALSGLGCVQGCASSAKDHPAKLHDTLDLPQCRSH